MIVWADVSHSDNHDIEVLITCGGDGGLDELWYSVVAGIHGEIVIILSNVDLALSQVELSLILEFVSLMRSIGHLSDHGICESGCDNFLSFICGLASSIDNRLTVGASTPQVLESFLKFSFLVEHLLSVSLCLSFIHFSSSFQGCLVFFFISLSSCLCSCDSDLSGSICCLLVLVNLVLSGLSCFSSLLSHLLDLCLCIFFQLLGLISLLLK